MLAFDDICNRLTCIHYNAVYYYCVCNKQFGLVFQYSSVLLLNVSINNCANSTNSLLGYHGNGKYG